MPIRIVTGSEIVQGFSDDLIFFKDSMTSYLISDFDQVSVTITGLDKHQDEMVQYYFVRGSPYITLQVLGHTLQLTSAAAIIQWIKISSTEYQFTLNNGHTWMLFISIPVELSWTFNGGITSSGPITAVIRLAVVPPGNAHDEMKILRQYANVYPVGAIVEADLDNFAVVFQWQVKYMNKENSQELLLLTLPHHRSGMLNITSVPIEYFAMKGAMRGILGKTWTVSEKRPETPWTMPWVDSKQHADIVLQAVQVSLNDWTCDPSTTYTFGKQIASLARDTLIAFQFNRTVLVQQGLTVLKTALTPWLEGTSVNAFRYDTTWGGIVTADGVKDAHAEFGAGYYSDHHFRRFFHPKIELKCNIFM